MKKYLLFISFMLIWEGSSGLWAQVPIDFTGAGAVVFIKNLKRSVEHPTDIFLSNIGSNADHDQKYFTARTLFRLGSGADPLTKFEQNALRNEICATNELHNILSLPTIGSIGVYQYGQSIVAVGNDTLGIPLERALNGLNELPIAAKRFIAKYYIATLFQHVDTLEDANINLPNLDLSNFDVTKFGDLAIKDLSEARLGINDDLQQQKNRVMSTLVPKIYQLLFRNPTEAQAEYAALVTVALGTDPQVVANSGAARTHNWSINEMKALSVASLGYAALVPTANFTGGMTGNAGGDDTAALAVVFDNNVAAFLQEDLNKPIYGDARSTLQAADHTTADAGNGSFGIGVNVVSFIKDNVNAAYANLGALCAGWNGR